MAGFPTVPFPLAPLDTTWGTTTFQNSNNPFGDTLQPSLLQFSNSLKDNHNIHDDDDNIDVDGLHDAANFILGNTLHYTPHNFHQPIVIPYPTAIGGCYDETTTQTNNHNHNSNGNNHKKRNNLNNSVIQLPVCAKCKRHSKTRDICRIKFGHTDVPWTNTYICITLDESCFMNREEEEDGTCSIRKDEKLHAVVLPSPSPSQSKNGNSNENNAMLPTYRVNTCFDRTTPVCKTCKQSNRTKAYCRTKLRHRELPWNTLFVLLKLQQQCGADADADADDTATSGGASNERDGGDGAIAEFLDTFRDGDEGERCDEANNNNNTKMMPPSLPTMDKLVAVQNEVEAEAEEDQTSSSLEAEFDINCIAPSRTFLSIISSTENSIRWLTRVASEDDDDDNDNSATYKKKSSFHQQQQSQEINFISNLDEPITTKKTRKKKKKPNNKSSKQHTKKKNPKSNNNRYKKIDNTAALALEAIEYAKKEAKKEQDAALLLTQKFTRFAQHPQFLQQQQQQLLLQQQQQQQQQQAMYHLQDTEDKQRKATYENDQSYDEKMPVAVDDDDLGVINEPEDEEDKMSSMLNGDDILDEAAKLAEWL